MSMSNILKIDSSSLVNDESTFGIAVKEGIMYLRDLQPHFPIYLAPLLLNDFGVIEFPSNNPHELQ